MEKIVNIITLGEMGVGKTSIINRINEDKFDERIKPTIKIDIITIKKPYKNMTMILKFHDTIGQESFMNVLPIQYIRDSHIILLVFDSIETLNVLRHRWFGFYKEHTNTENPIFILIGNKSDTFGNERDEIVRQGDEFSQEINAHFITCSAKSKDNIDNLERYIITESRRYIDEEEKNNKNKGINQEKIEKKHLDKKKMKKEKKGCCS
jgi:small GTP-binding protein